MSEDCTPFALVADDDALIRVNAVDILETAGVRVYEAVGTAQALAILEEAATAYNCSPAMCRCP